MDSDNDSFILDPGSSNRTKQECQNYDQNFLYFCLPPAVFIILLLSLLQHRKRTCACERSLLACLRGRFAIVVSVDFMSTLQNRWSYAFAFGAVTPQMVSLILMSDPLLMKLPSFLKVFGYMVAALKVGVVCMPLFACLSTPHQLLGGVLGLLYSLFWFTTQVWELIWCQGTDEPRGGLRNFLMDYEWLMDLPVLVCLGFLVGRFGFQIVQQIQIYQEKNYKQEEVNNEHYKYVHRLLRRPAERSVQKSWFQRNVYEWDPYFKFPNRIIATVVLSFLGVYLMVLLEQMLTLIVVYLLQSFNDHISVLFDLSQHISYATHSWYVSSACAIFSSVVHISHVMVYYRKHIKSLRAGDRSNLPRMYTPSPAESMCGLLKYPGYQIAFTLWGYLIVHLAMFMACLVFVYTVISPIHEHGFLPWLLNLLIFLSNFFMLMGVVWLQRLFVHMFFLQDKISPEDKDKPLALDNRRAFHNFNYFLFFYNVIMGFMSCLMRLIKSTGVGLLLVSRIERTIMPQGFVKLDKSYCTWVGMIISDHHHSNPILLCFCHLLLRHRLSSAEVEEESHWTSEPHVIERVRSRWLLMYTLVRNPKLIQMRKHAKQNTKDAEFAFAWAIANIP